MPSSINPMKHKNTNIPSIEHSNIFVKKETLEDIYMQQPFQKTHQALLSFHNMVGIHRI